MPRRPVCKNSFWCPSRSSSICQSTIMFAWTQCSTTRFCFQFYLIKRICGGGTNLSPESFCRCSSKCRGCHCPAVAEVAMRMFKPATAICHPSVQSVPLQTHRVQQPQQLQSFDLSSIKAMAIRTRWIWIFVSGWIPAVPKGNVSANAFCQFCQFC